MAMEADLRHLRYKEKYWGKSIQELDLSDCQRCTPSYRLPDDTSSKTLNKLANPNAPLGYELCFLNLVVDGFTNATQDSILARLVSMLLCYEMGHTRLSY